MSNDERRRARALAARKKRRRRRIAAGVSLSVLLLTVGVVLCLTVFFKITAVEVTGDEVYNPEQITLASEIQSGENLFLFSSKDATEKIQKTLPYVESATIARHLSGKVTITVTAAKAVAALDNGEYYTLLNASGKVLEDGVMAINDGITLIEAGEITTALPGEQIVFASEDAFADFTATMQAFADVGISESITILDVSSHTNIKAEYKGRIKLELGAASSIPDKMEFVTATLQRNEKNTPDFKGTIDFTIDKKAYQNAETQPTTTEPAPVSETTSQTDSTGDAA